MNSRCYSKFPHSLKAKYFHLSIAVLSPLAPAPHTVFEVDVDVVW